jgi:cytochrome c biogenesis protein ResB
MIWLGRVVFILAFLFVGVSGCSFSFRHYRKDQREMREVAKIKEQRKKETKELYDKAVERHKRLQSKETQQQMENNKKKTKRK